AYANTRYYPERFDQLAVDVRDVRDFADFCTLPILTKADLRQRSYDLLARGYEPSQLLSSKTSGSSGTPVEVWCTDERRQFSRACTLRSDEWSGWRLGERVAAVWGNPGYLKHGWRGR